MVAGFLTPLRTEKVGPRRWLLTDDLVFRSELYAGNFVVLRGFQTDFASIPRLFWVIAPKVDAYDAASVVHDAGYGHALYTEQLDRIHAVKHVADNLFLEGMLASGVPGWRARLMYRMVSIFGDPVVHPLRQSAPILTGELLV